MVVRVVSANKKKRKMTFVLSELIKLTHSKAVLAFRQEAFRSISRLIATWKYVPKLGKVNVLKVTEVLKSKEHSYT